MLETAIIILAAAIVAAAKIISSSIEEGNELFDDFAEMVDERLADIAEAVRTDAEYGTITMNTNEIRINAPEVKIS
jgi:vacuolar-type H+-ATPase subunit H